VGLLTGGGRDAVQQGVDDDAGLTGERGPDQRVGDGEDQAADQVGYLVDGQPQPVGVGPDHLDQRGVQSGVVGSSPLLVVLMGRIARGRWVVSEGGEQADHPA